MNVVRSTWRVTLAELVFFSFVFGVFCGDADQVGCFKHGNCVSWGYLLR